MVSHQRDASIPSFKFQQQKKIAAFRWKAPLPSTILPHGFVTTGPPSTVTNPGNWHILSTGKSSSQPPSDGYIYIYIIYISWVSDRVEIFRVQPIGHVLHGTSSKTAVQLYAAQKTKLTDTLLKHLNPKVPIFQNCSQVPAKYRKHLQANLTMFSSIVSEPSWRNSTAWPQENQRGQIDDGFVVFNGNPPAIPRPGDSPRRRTRRRESNIFRRGNDTLGMSRLQSCKIVSTKSTCYFFLFGKVKTLPPLQL